MGIDGGGLDDLLGLAVLGREKGTRRWLLWSRAWANLAVLDRRKGEVSLLRDFEEAGDLVICKEFGEDVAGITELAQRIDGQGLLSAVALDPFGVGAIVDALYEIGIGGQERVVGITQGWKLRGNAIIITKQASGTAKIDPLMAAFNAVAWMASNPASTQPSIFWL